jgi:5-methylcytosine-specific restriction enzyme subunit McrC
MKTPTILTLTEYQTQSIPRSEFSEKYVEIIDKNYKNQIKIDLKYSPTGDQWKITPQGWVGYIPLTPDFAIYIQPKIPIKNLFLMLEYAYHLKSFKFLDGLTQCETIADFYNRFVTLLTQKINTRIRQGLYKTYLTHSETLPYIRGKLDIKHAILSPWKIAHPCTYNQQTPDIEDNQIILWTLYCLLQNKLCDLNNESQIRHLFHTLKGYLTLTPFTPQTCLNRHYNRLNEDYLPIHQLCYFFLSNFSPSHQIGNDKSIPFIVNMNQLYELFVTEWLTLNLPPEFTLKSQYHFKQGNLSFKIDLIIYDTKTKQPYCVLDTKYKLESHNNDVMQITTYALSQKCNKAVLIYPQKPDKYYDEILNTIHLNSLVFSISDDLEKVGQKFLNQLILNIVKQTSTL